MQKDWHYIHQTFVTPRYNAKIIKDNELKLGALTNTTSVFLEQLLPIPALAAGDQLGHVVNDLHFQDACQVIREIRGQK